MGIVLPDGNLNNPSLSWLRRWAEGKARLAAVVSLPEETFRSAEATVKASLVFLRRFNETDTAAWEDAWQRAHAKHDAVFNAERTRVCGKYGPRIAAGDTTVLAAIPKDSMPWVCAANCPSGNKRNRHRTRVGSA